MIDVAGMSSTERKTALSALVNLLRGADCRDKTKEAVNYQKCYSVMEFVRMSDVDTENFTLHKKEGKELVQQLLPMTVISRIKQLKNCTCWSSTTNPMFLSSLI